jgi:diadenosine tetraphosphatase ApaH/serine/threonine PP2A family protein phosphatase
LRTGPQFVGETITICHGAPFDEDYYIFGEFDAAEAFDHIKTPVCFFGHTHFPFVYSEKENMVEGTFMEGDTNEVKLEKGARYLINPGSVGQPRDRNPRAACAIYDSDARTIKFYRLEYNIKEAQRKILAEHLPSALAERLSLGI